MPIRARITIVVVLSFIAIIAVALSGRFRHNVQVAVFLNDEPSYAEISTTSPLFATVSTSTLGAIDLPILVYHIVRPSYPTDSAAVRALGHTPETFDAEMKYLQDAHYHVVKFSDLENYFKNGKLLPPNPIIISFDDGWSDQFTYAFPILEKYHYTATFFVFTNPIGRRGFLSWSDLKALLAAGMTIGSHSRSHPYLTRDTDPAVLWNEIAGSKEALEKHLGITVGEFAYPFGAYNANIVAMVQKAGYLSARGDRMSGEQAASHPYELGALNAPTTLALFKQRFPAH